MIPQASRAGGKQHAGTAHQHICVLAIPFVLGSCLRLHSPHLPGMGTSAKGPSREGLAEQETPHGDLERLEAGWVKVSGAACRQTARPGPGKTAAPALASRGPRVSLEILM